MNSYEKKYSEYKNIAGVDEVGRGCLFGPVVAACVILPKDFDYSGINDSKKLSKKKREELFEYIVEHAVSYNTSFIDNVIIDNINILEASKLAMIQAIYSLNVKPDVVLIDAVPLDIKIKNESIIKGDSLSYSIACASIIAKVTRDKYIEKLSKKYPWYGLETNMGYGTKKHLEGLFEHGVTKYHRITFKPVCDLVKD